MDIYFDSVEKIIQEANKRNLKISEVTINQTAKDTEKSEEEVFNTMKESLNVMKQSVENGLKEGNKSISGLTGDMANTYKKYIEKGNSLSGDFIGEVLYNALAVSEENASMGRIVSCPTAGSCGILPGVLIALQNKYNIKDDAIVLGMFNASALGMVIQKNASISGAEGGCQAECGSAAAMAASAIVEIMGGTPEMCADAAAQALKSIMGLVCDPVAGLVEEPCVIRNASCASLAITCADLTLSGIKSIIPLDEVIIAMDKVGHMLPYQLRETALGGIADSKTAREIEGKLFNSKGDC